MNRLRLFSLMVLCLFVAGLGTHFPSRSAAAEPKLNYFFPAGATRGKTTQVNASGTFGNWPVQAWVNRPGLTVTAAEKKGQLQIEVDAQATGGIYWVRLFDKEGASSLRPFLVDSLPEQLETEPNDSPKDAQAIVLPQIVNGKLSKKGEVDGFAVQLKQGETLVASLEGNFFLNSPMDSVLQLTDAQGYVIQQNNDARGLDPQIIYTAKTDGTYLVRAFAFPSAPNSTIGFAGADTYLYRLTLTTGPYLDHSIPLVALTNEPTAVELVGWNLPKTLTKKLLSADEAAHGFVSHPDVAGYWPLSNSNSFKMITESKPEDDQAQLLSLPVIISGKLALKGEKDRYRFQATKGQKISFKLRSHSIGFPLDAVIEIIDPAGKSAEYDDASKLKDPVVSYTVKSDGELQVVVKDLHGRGGLRFPYELTVSEVRPDFTLTVDSDLSKIKSGESQEITVKVNRTDGFKLPIEIQAIDLPEGITMTPVTSSGEGDTAKEVKLKLTATKESASGAFRIQGKATAEESTISHNARFTIKDRSDTLDWLWVTVE
ncbi:MAG: pre-peptidase [Blastopirellula sp.]|nr:MAG: pre-peptidase [Blastopirellula sp.]